MKDLLTTPVIIVLAFVNLICIVWQGIEIDAYTYRGDPINWIPLIIIGVTLSFLVGGALIEYYIIDRIKKKQELNKRQTLDENFYRQRKRLEKD